VREMLGRAAGPPACRREAAGSTSSSAGLAVLGTSQLLLRAGFAEPEPERRIPIGPPWGATTPDFYYADPSARLEGICIYFDCMSDGLDGNPETAARDHQLREALRERQYEVISIPASVLNDRERLTSLFYRLARLLMDRNRADEL